MSGFGRFVRLLFIGAIGTATAFAFVDVSLLGTLLLVPGLVVGLLVGFVRPRNPERAGFVLDWGTTMGIPWFVDSGGVHWRTPSSEPPSASHTAQLRHDGFTMVCDESPSGLPGPSDILYQGWLLLLAPTAWLIAGDVARLDWGSLLIGLPMAVIAVSMAWTMAYMPWLLVLLVVDLWLGVTETELEVRGRRVRVGDQWLPLSPASVLVRSPRCLVIEEGGERLVLRAREPQILEAQTLLARRIASLSEEGTSDEVPVSMHGLRELAEREKM